MPVGPRWLETGFDYVWLTKIKSKTVFRIDLTTNKIVARIPVGSNPELGIDMGLGFAWVSDTKDRTLTQIDPKTSNVVRVTPVNIPDDTEGSIGVGEGSVWGLTNEGGTDSGTLARLDPATNRVVATIDVGVPGDAGDLSIWDHNVWVAAEGIPLSQIDAATHKVLRHFAGGRHDDTMRVDFGAAWIVHENHGQIWRVDLNKLAQTPSAN